MIKSFINNLPRRLKGMFSPKAKKIAISSLLTTSLVFGVAANPLAKESLTTVYYVYLNNEYIGTISDKKVVEEVVTEKVEQFKKEYKNFDLELGSQLSYIPEQVFRSTANDQSVVAMLDTELKPQIESTAVIIGGQPAVYLENEEQANHVIQSLKLRYVTKEQLAELAERQKSPNIDLPPLNKNESRILDVYFSEDVTIKSEKTQPEKILTVVEAVKLIRKGTLEEKKYLVQEGDVLGSIAMDHNLSLEQILKINPDLNENSLLQIGQEVNVTVPQALVNVIVEKEVNKREKIPYQKQVEETTKMYKGDIKVKQKGQEGVRAVTYVISQENGQTVKRQTVKADVLVNPVTKVVLKGTKVIPSRGEGNFSWPTSGGYVSSQMGYRWSRMHKGIDIARPNDRTIKTVDNGVVVFAGWDGGYGNKIVVDHQNGYRTVYAHLSSIEVNVGQTVPKGSQIGVMGSTGDSTGVHLHFEVYKNGSLVNPLTILR
ncbi:peptidoglycan DD-metalloendopeptidase family protein [Pseudoneobacillus sp. C159]